MTDRTDRKRFKVTGLWQRKDPLNRVLFTARLDVDKLYTLLEDMEDQGVTRFDVTVFMSEGKRSNTSPDAMLLFSEYTD